MDLDLSLLRAIVRTDKGYYTAKRSGVSTKMFEGPSIAGWSFIEDHILENGKTPSETYFTAKTGIRFDDDGEQDLVLLIKESKSRFLWNRLKSVQAELTEDLENSKPHQGFQKMQSFIKEVYKEGLSSGKTENLLSLGGEVVDLYDLMKTGVRGIPSPWDALNEMTLGWWPGDFVVFVARMSVGKTFCLLMLALSAWMSGKKVLFVGTEMSRMKLAFRFFSIHLKLPYTEFKAGKLGFEQEERMRASVKALSKEDGLYVVGDEFDAKIEEIEAAIEEIDPEIIIVDGIYLVRNEGRNRQERVSNTADDLKRLARRKQKVVIGSTQFNRGASTNSKSVIDASNVGLSDVIGWNCILPESLVFTEKGIYQLSELKGTEIFWDGRGNTSGMVVDTGEKEVWEVELEIGLKIRCSGDHRVFTLNEQTFGLEAVPVKCLTEDSIVPVMSKFEGGNDSIGEFISPRGGGDIEFPKKWTPKLAEFIGYCVGNGHVNNERSWGIGMSFEDVDVADRLVENVQELFSGYTPTSGGKKTCYLVSLNNVKIIGFIQWLGVAEHWLSSTKDIPLSVWKTTLDIRRAFLRGYFSADGEVLKTGNIVLTTVSEKLSQATHKMLLSVGIMSTIRPAKINQARDGGYKIWIDLFQSKKFIDEIGFMSDRKTQMAKDRCNPSDRKRSRPIKPFSYVRSVKCTGEVVPMKDVVGTKNGMFIADFIPVHNSDVMIGMYQTEDMKEDHIMGFRPMKLREGSGEDFFSNWNFEEMDFSQVDIDAESDFQDGDYNKVLDKDSGSDDFGGSDDDDEGGLF